MNDNRLTANRRFLENLFRKGPFERHGFVLAPEPLHCPHTRCPPYLGPWVSNDECGDIRLESRVPRDTSLPGYRRGAFKAISARRMRRGVGPSSR